MSEVPPGAEGASAAFPAALTGIGQSGRLAAASRAVNTLAEQNGTNAFPPAKRRPAGNPTASGRCASVTARVCRPISVAARVAPSSSAAVKNEAWARPPSSRPNRISAGGAVLLATSSVASGRVAGWPRVPALMAMGGRVIGACVTVSGVIEVLQKREKRP